MATLELDLVASEVTLTLLKAALPDEAAQIDQLHDQAKTHPSPALIARHRAIKESIERILDEENPQDALMKFLREWKPSGPSQ